MDPFDLEIEGVVVKGHGVASGRSPDSPYPKSTIAMQKPYFKAKGLDLDGYFFDDTLNISISPQKFRIIKPRFSFPFLRWTDLHPPETFSFSACQLKPHRMLYEGWIYYPHPETKNVHFQDESTIEIIAPHIPKIKYGTSIMLLLNSEEVCLIEQ